MNYSSKRYTFDDTEIKIKRVSFSFSLIYSHCSVKISENNSKFFSEWTTFSDEDCIVNVKEVLKGRNMLEDMLMYCLSAIRYPFPFLIDRSFGIYGHSY